MQASQNITKSPEQRFLFSHLKILTVLILLTVISMLMPFILDPSKKMSSIVINTCQFVSDAMLRKFIGNRKSYTYVQIKQTTHLNKQFFPLKFNFEIDMTSKRMTTDGLTQVICWRMSYLGVVPVIGFNDALRMTSPLIQEKSTQKNIKRHHRLCADIPTGISHSPNKVVN